MTRRVPAILSALALACLGADAGPVRVLHADLRLENATLIGADDAGVTLRPDDGRARRVPLGSLLAVSAGATDALPRIEGVAEPANRVFVELVDGQRLLVDLAETGDPDAIAGPVLGLGAGRIPLERVARVARPGSPWHAPAPDADLVLLTNGDRLGGFVAAIGPVVRVETDDGAVSEIPLGLIDEIRLANPPEPAPGLIVTDDRGVALRPRVFGIDEDLVLAISVDPGPLGVDSRGEDTIAYTPSGARLLSMRVVSGQGRALALAARPPGSVRPTGDRRWTPEPETLPARDPAIGLGDLRMPGPAEAVFPIEPGVRAARFAGAVRAAAPGDWTDLIVRVHAETRVGERVPLAEHRLTRSGPHAEIAADLPEGVRAVVLEVDPGRFGAVQDAVVFEAPRLLVRE